MRPWTGESVAEGRYAIGDVLGRGRDARVHRATDQVLRRSVAVKFLPVAADGRAPARWRTEAAALDRFDHHHIVRLLDGGETADAAFLVFPLLPDSLGSRLEQGPMTRSDAARVVLALAGALGEVHRAGMVHGGVDVGGVLLDEAGLPCWSGLPDPVADAHDRAAERDLAALATLAVRCVTGDGTPTTAPSPVLDVVRRAAVDPGTPDLHNRLTSALEAVAPPRRLLPVAPFVSAARRRARPGFAAVLGLGFAASVLAGLVVDAGSWRATIGDGLDHTPGAAVLADDPASSDIASSVRDALGRLGSLPDGATEPPVRAATGSPASDSGGSSTAGDVSATRATDDPASKGAGSGTPVTSDDGDSRDGDPGTGGAAPTTHGDDGAYGDGATTREGERADASDDEDGRSDRGAGDARSDHHDEGDGDHAREDRSGEDGDRGDGDHGDGDRGDGDRGDSGEHVDVRADGGHAGQDGSHGDGSGSHGSDGSDGDSHSDGSGDSDESGTGSGDDGGSDAGGDSAGHGDGGIAQALGDLV